MTLDLLRPPRIVVNNVGSLGVDLVDPVMLASPTLTVGAVSERPASYDGQVQLRRLVTLRLTADYRNTGAAAAAALLVAVADRLERQPSS